MKRVFVRERDENHNPAIEMVLWDGERWPEGEEREARCDSDGKKCKKQGKQCRQFIIADCQDSSDVQACLDRTLPCCDPFARCNAAAGFACFED